MDSAKGYKQQAPWLTTRAAATQELYAAVAAARRALKARGAELEARPWRPRGKPASGAKAQGARSGGLPPREAGAATPEPQGPRATTLAEYRRTGERLLRDTPEATWRAAATPAAGKATLPKATWTKRHAALLWYAREELEQLLREQDKLARAGAAKIEHPSYERWQALVQEAEFMREVLETRPGLEGGVDVDTAAMRKRKSKRKSLTGLPPTWRAKVFALLPQKWRLPFLVQAISGCRPVEISAGVKLRIVGGNLEALVGGAKVTSYSGQPTRTLRWRVGREGLVADMVDAVAAAGGELVVSWADHTPAGAPAALTKAITRAARRLYPDHRQAVTCYSVRHAYAADCKASEIGGDQVSAALGHRVDVTKGSYGFRAQSRGHSVAPDQVEVPLPVKQKKAKTTPQADIIKGARATSAQNKSEARTQREAARFARDGDLALALPVPRPAPRS